MSTHAADSQFSFQLPSLSYIDARWEEPELRAGANVALLARKAGLTAWLMRRVAALKAWHRDNVAASELNGMSDRELLDIGVSRYDVGRLFDPAFNEEMRRRGRKV